MGAVLSGLPSLRFEEKEMTKKEIDFAKECVSSGDVKRFYNSALWLRKRDEVLSLDHHECQRCRHKYHRYRAADTVHHVNHFKKHPELALSVYYWEPQAHKRKRNLISLCHDCHEEVHSFRNTTYHEPLTLERWD